MAVESIFWQPTGTSEEDAAADPPFVEDIEQHLATLAERNEDEHRAYFEGRVAAAVLELEIRETARLRAREAKEALFRSEDGQQEAAERFAEGIVDLDDLPEPDPLIDGFLTLDSFVRTFGPPKSLKSFVTLDMAACVSLGIPWQGHDTRKVPVLYVVAEGARGMKKRRAAWNEFNDAEMAVTFYPKPVQIGEDAEMRDLIAYCRVKQVGYVIFDTQARCTVGFDENSNTEMGSIVFALDMLKQETGACVHLVHHSGSGDTGRGRGATAFDGAVDAEFKTDRDDDLLTLVTRYQKDIAEASDVELAVVEAANSLAVAPATGGRRMGPSDDVDVPQISEAMVVYLNVLGEARMTGLTAAQVASDAGRGKEPTRQAVNKLGAMGLIHKKGMAYFITRLGDAALAKHARATALADAPENVQTVFGE